MNFHCAVTIRSVNEALGTASLGQGLERQSWAWPGFLYSSSYADCELICTIRGFESGLW